MAQWRLRAAIDTHKVLAKDISHEVSSMLASQAFNAILHHFVAVKCRHSIDSVSIHFGVCTSGGMCAHVEVSR